MESLYESLLDDFDTINSKIDPKEEIKRFLKDNYSGAYIISDKLNKDGLCEVSAIGNIKVKNLKITSLTNNLFVWGKVGGTFNCNSCQSLTSLEGAPKIVGRNFDCSYTSITSLKGAPEKVGGGFLCCDCYSLTSLEGASEKVGGNFDCSYCKSLPSLEGAPKEVGGDFDCKNCKNKFIVFDVRSISIVEGHIYV